jgi:hypothetical protein
MEKNPKNHTFAQSTRMLTSDRIVMGDVNETIRTPHAKRKMSYN